MKTKSPPHEFFFLLYEESKVEAALAAARVVPLEATNDNGLTPLHRAVQSGRLDVCRTLIERGADVDVRTDDQKDNRNRTPLHFPPLNSRLVQLLIDAGADIHAQDKWGFTPLHWAAQHNRANTCDVLLKHGANLHAYCIDGDTPLHRAAYNGSVDSARVLIHAGATPDDLPGPQAKKPWTPLHLAISRDSQEFVAAMAREFGADMAQRTNAGRTLIQLAGKNHEMRDLLLSLRSEILIKDAVPQIEGAAESRGHGTRPL